MRRFVAEHAAAAAGARGGEGGTRCSIFTLCLIADLGVDYINLIPPRVRALPFRMGGEVWGDRLTARGGGCINIGWRRFFSLSFSLSSERSPADLVESTLLTTRFFLGSFCGGGEAWEGVREERVGGSFIERRN